MMMEVSGATVTRSGSFRKRRLETRPSDGTDLPTKHERAPSETEMDFSPSPTKLTSTGSNAVIGGLSVHIQGTARLEDVMKLAKYQKALI